MVAAKTLCFVVSASICLWACAPATLDDLRSNPGTALEFDTLARPRTVYLEEIEMFKKCMEYSLNRWDYMTIEPTFDGGTKTATIPWVAEGEQSPRFWGVVDIAPAEDGSHVRTFTAPYPDVPAFGRRVKEWADGSKDCGREWTAPWTR
ncbi:MAG TPA: hypothetical protein VGI20_13640 [Rhizomicrobium sp.]